MGPLLQRVHRWLEGASAFLTGPLALLLIAFVGAADWLTGQELSSSVFYVVPAATAAWYAGPTWAIAVCFVSAATWYAADLAAGATYSAIWIPVWNAGVRLAFFIIIAELLRRLRASLDVQRRLAEVDALTGLSNARRFLSLLDTEVARSARYHRAVSLAYLDLDGFKAVNDRWGHHVGDQVLARVGALLRTHVRATDVAARLGGDEFALLLPETDQTQAREAMEKLRLVLERAMSDAGWDVGFSLGVVSAVGEVPESDEMLRLADGLMYEAKHAGKARTTYGAARA